MAAAQKPEEIVVQRMKAFHKALVDNKQDITGFIDDSLSYGHSNGWIEDRKDFLSDLGRRLVYHSFSEDSIKAGVNKNLAYVRFVADVDVTRDGKRNTYHLKVLEIWIKRKNWILFARQAIR
jgi:hypothetical protein